VAVLAAVGRKSNHYASAILVYIMHPCFAFCSYHASLDTGLSSAVYSVSLYLDMLLSLHLPATFRPSMNNGMHFHCYWSVRSSFSPFMLVIAPTNMLLCFIPLRNLAYIGFGLYLYTCKRNHPIIVSHDCSLAIW
jgi:hypothetical protein